MREPPLKPFARYGKNLKFLLGDQQVSVAKVAALAKITPKQVYNLINGNHDPRLKSLERVANAFGLAAWQMLAIDMETSPTEYKQVLRLLELYSSADEAARATIMQVAEIASQKGSK